MFKAEYRRVNRRGELTIGGLYRLVYDSPGRGRPHSSLSTA